MYAVFKVYQLLVIKVFFAYASMVFCWTLFCCKKDPVCVAQQVFNDRCKSKGHFLRIDKGSLAGIHVVGSGDGTKSTTTTIYTSYDSSYFCLSFHIYMYLT